MADEETSSGLRRKQRPMDPELKAKLDGMSDDDVLTLGKQITTYIKDNFMEVATGGNSNTEGETQQQEQPRSLVERFFG